jgi:hypothetical protein
MFNITKFFSVAANGALLSKNNGAVAHNGPWKHAYPNTVLDRWHVGDFSTAEYTISVDYNMGNREIVKCTIVANVQTASVVIYARNNLGNDLITISADVNNSYVDIVVNPVQVISIVDDEEVVTFDSAGARVIYTVQYFYNQLPLSV